MNEQCEENAVQDLTQRVVAPAPSTIHSPRREYDEKGVEHEQHFRDSSVTRVKNRTKVKKWYLCYVPDTSFFDAIEQFGVEVPISVERWSLQADKDVQNRQELECVEGWVAWNTVREVVSVTGLWHVSSDEHVCYFTCWNDLRHFCCTVCRRMNSSSRREWGTNTSTWHEWAQSIQWLDLVNTYHRMLYVPKNVARQLT